MIHDEEDEIDNNWVDAYKKAEDNYNEFYNEKVHTVKVFFMYINNEKTVVNMRQEMLTLTTESILKREQLIALIKEKQILNNVKYKLFSLVKYNIDLQPDEINDFTSISDSHTISDSPTEYETRFLMPEKYINDIYFTDTISIFQDLNALYIIFKEKHPDCIKSISPFSDQYNKLIIEAMGGSGNEDIDNENKIRLKTEK